MKIPNKKILALALAALMLSLAACGAKETPKNAENTPTSPEIQTETNKTEDKTDETENPNQPTETPNSTANETADTTNGKVTAQYKFTKAAGEAVAGTIIFEVSGRSEGEWVFHNPKEKFAYWDDTGVSAESIKNLVDAGLCEKTTIDQKLFNSLEISAQKDLVSE